MATVAALAALLFPALHQAKESGKSAACKSNLRQQAIALLIYTDEHGYFPPASETGANGAVIASWSQRLALASRAYTGVFRCPKRKVAGYGLNKHGTFAQGNAAENVLGLGADVDQRKLFTLDWLIPASKVKVPSEMIAIGDSHEYGPDVEIGKLTIINALGSIGPYQWLGPPGARHKRGANIVFCDGHVEWEKQTHWTRRLPEVRRRWNNDHEPHPETWKID